MSTTIGVVVPTYNDSHFLSGALGSIAEQDYPVGHVVVVDDGSHAPGEVEQAVEETRAAYPALPLVLLRQGNGGPGSARNAGLALLETEFVAFLDADDRWLPQNVSSKLVAFQHSPRRVGAVYGGAIEVLADGRRRRQPMTVLPDGGADPRAVGVRGGIPGGAPFYLFRREVLRALGGFDGTLSNNEDFDLLLRLLVEYDVLGIPAPGLLRYRRPGSFSGRDPMHVFLGVERFLNKAAAVGYLPRDEILRRKKLNRLGCARRLIGNSKMRGAALSLLAEAFEEAGPEGPAEWILWAATRLLGGGERERT